MLLVLKNPSFNPEYLSLNQETLSENDTWPQLSKVWEMKSHFVWLILLGKSLSHQISTLALRFVSAVVFSLQLGLPSVAEVTWLTLGWRH